MNQLLKWSVKYEVLKGNMKSVLKSKKGSPTMEYVVVLAIGAVFAGLLLFVFKDDGTSKTIKDKFADYVTKLVGGVTTPEQPKQ